ncbi:unnamed protein product, partial [Rotaria sp. Silwood2]
LVNILKMIYDVYMKYVHVFIHYCTEHNEHINEEQRMINSSSITSSSDNTLIELFAELYARTKQSSTLP